MARQPHTVIIGAGVGGLTAGALLLKAGHRITVLEAHVYPGGCAGTFYHKGYRFDAGATLAGGFSPGGPHARIAELLDLTWPVRPADPAWMVHLPDGRRVTQWADPDRWQAEWRQQQGHSVRADLIEGKRQIEIALEKNPTLAAAMVTEAALLVIQAESESDARTKTALALQAEGNLRQALEVNPLLARENAELEARIATLLPESAL